MTARESDMMVHQRIADALRDDSATASGLFASVGASVSPMYGHFRHVA